MKRTRQKKLRVTHDGKPKFFQALVARYTISRACRVSLIVGTILTVINQWDRFLEGAPPPLWMILLTYAVPYCVSSYSTAALLSDPDI